MGGVAVIAKMDASTNGLVNNICARRDIENYLTMAIPFNIFLINFGVIVDIFLSYH